MIHREDAEQKALIQWADMANMPAKLAVNPGDKIGNYLFAIPNGGARRKVEAARLKGLGVRPGVSDLFLSFPKLNGASKSMIAECGLYIEMKAPKPHSSRLTPTQKQFQKRMFKVMYATVVCYGFYEAKQCIEDYLS